MIQVIQLGYNSSRNPHLNTWRFWTIALQHIRIMRYGPLTDRNFADMESLELDLFREDNKQFYVLAIKLMPTYEIFKVYKNIADIPKDEIHVGYAHAPLGKTVDTLFEEIEHFNGELAGYAGLVSFYTDLNQDPVYYQEFYGANNLSLIRERIEQEYGPITKIIERPIASVE